MSSWLFASSATCSCCMASARSVQFEDGRLQQNTVHLVLQGFDLRVGFVNDLIHLLAECVELVREVFRQMLLVDDLLRRLIAVEGETATGALHDDRRTQAAEHAGLIVFGGIKAGNNDVVRIVEGCAACWARSACVCRAREPSGVGTLCAEDMTT